MCHHLKFVEQGSQETHILGKMIHVFQKILWKLLLLTICIRSLENKKTEEFKGRNATWKSKKVDFLQ